MQTVGEGGGHRYLDTKGGENMKPGEEGRQYFYSTCFLDVGFPGHVLHVATQWLRQRITCKNEEVSSVTSAKMHNVEAGHAVLCSM